MTRSRLTALLVSGLLSLPLAAIGAGWAAASQSANQSTGQATGRSEPCRWASRGFVENRWLGGAGSWSDATHWSRGVVPGVAARDYACIPSDSDIVIDALAPRIDLDLLELGTRSRLTLEPGTALFLSGAQDVVRSITKRHSLIEVDGATLGGAGRLRVIGKVDIHASRSGSPALLTTTDGSGVYTGPRGILEIGDQGTLDVRGHDDVRMSSGYIVDVHGRTRLRGHAGLVADHGTTFLLQKHFYGKGVGRLVILDDRGFLEGDPSGTEPKATFVNRGGIAKRWSRGTSRIEARYVDAGKVRVRSGRLVLPHRTVTPQVYATPVTGGCSPVLPCTDGQDQVALLKAPASDTDGVGQVSIEELSGEKVKGAIGVPMKVHADGLDATLADPAVIQLTYGLFVFKNAGRSADPATLTVEHADGAGDPYVPIPSCEGTGIPLGAFACLDHAASRKSNSSVVLVIRTIDTSRWIVS